MKKLLLAGTTVFLMATSAHAQSGPTWYLRNGSAVVANTSRTVRTSNGAASYDSNGRLTGYMIRHGDKANLYDARGRLIYRGVRGPNGLAIYDLRGRLQAWTPHRGS